MIARVTKGFEWERTCYFLFAFMFNRVCSEVSDWASLLAQNRVVKHCYFCPLVMVKPEKGIRIKRNGLWWRGARSQNLRIRRYGGA